MDDKKFECFRCGGTRSLTKMVAGLICRECLKDVEICSHCGGIVGESETDSCPLCGGL